MKAAKCQILHAVSVIHFIWHSEKVKNIGIGRKSMVTRVWNMKLIRKRHREALGVNRTVLFFLMLEVEYAGPYIFVNIHGTVKGKCKL